MDMQSASVRSRKPNLKKFLTRSRLVDCLLDRRDRKVILIHGRAGQGKSTLASEFLQQGSESHLWYTLSEEDHDPFFLLERLEDSLNTTQKQELSPYQDSALFSSLRRFTKSLEDHFPGEFYLVLDDFHKVNPYTGVRDLVNLLMSALPDSAHMVLISREYPKLTLSQMIAAKDFLEIEDCELAFTREEAIELFNRVYEIDLTLAEIDEIFELTQGWSTGLVHLAQSLESKVNDLQRQIVRQFVSEKTLPSIRKFFEEEVFAALSAEKKESLVKMSIAGTFSPDLVSALSGRSGAVLIEGFQESNLFIEVVDTAKKKFAFHPLFSKYLSGLFHRLPESEQTKIHRAAAEFFRDNGKEGDATHHLLLSRGFTEAQKIFLSEADELLAGGQYRRLHELVAAFPEEVRNKNPLLLYYYTITTNLVQPFVSRRTLLDLLEIFRESGDVNREARIHSVLLVNYIFYQGNREAMEELDKTAQAFLDHSGSKLPLEARLTLEALISFGRWWTKPDLDEAFEIALRAEETAYKIRNEEVLIFSRFVLAKIYIDRGEFRQATEILKKTEQLIDKNPSFRQYEPLLRFYLGDSYFYSGELNQALEQAEQGLAKAFPEFSFAKYLKLNQVFYSLYIPELDKAEALLESVREENIGENLYVRYLSFYLLDMLLAYCKNDRKRAEFYCMRLMDPENQELLVPDFPYSYLALAEVLLYFEKYKPAVEILDRLVKEAPEQKYPYPNATAYALLGYIHDKIDNADKSKSFFRKMESILEEKGYRNLDVCNPALLHNIAIASNSGMFQEFPRLKHMSASQIINQSVSGLYLYTLGSFRIVLNGREIPSSMLARHKKVMDLLKLLIVHRRRGIVKEVLYQLFWPGYLEKSSRNNLNTIIYRLRKILGEGADYVSTSANMIGLNLDICTIDADDFESLVRLGELERKRENKQGALSAFLKAKEIYKGDFLEKDLYYDDIRDERENLKNCYLQLLMTLIKMYLDSGKPHQALELAKEILSKDPLCEPAYRLLMITSTLVGNRSEIPRIFERLNTKLLRFYNIEADPKTVALRNQLLGGSTPTPVMWQAEILI
jgi:ATP/maltotriose-dependent transcriptional regulator MalT/DNA-binding SARP family transcriptional activator